MNYRRLDHITDYSDHNFLTTNLHQTVKPVLRGGWIGGLLGALLVGLTPLAFALELSDLDGSNGFVINGINAYDNLGQSVSGVGDINGDGFDDLIIAAHGASPDGRSRAGESYVIFGSRAGFPASFDLSSLNGTNGFVIKGINASDSLGGTNLENGVSEAGDINGDGIDLGRCRRSYIKISI